MSENRLNSPDEVKLGMRLKDLVTGYTGIATRRVTFVNGCVQFGVEGTIAEGKSDYPFYSIDWNQLVIVDKGISETNVVALFNPRTDIKLGMRVKDIVSGVSGIAVYKSEYMSGRLMFTIQSALLPGETSVMQHDLDGGRIEFIDNGIYVPASEPTPAQKKSTGGPMMRLRN